AKDLGGTLMTFEKLIEVFHEGSLLEAISFLEPLAQYHIIDPWHASSDWALTVLAANLTVPDGVTCYVMELNPKSVDDDSRSSHLLDLIKVRKSADCNALLQSIVLLSEKTSLAPIDETAGATAADMLLITTRSTMWQLVAVVSGNSGYRYISENLQRNLIHAEACATANIDTFFQEPGLAEALGACNQVLHALLQEVQALGSIPRYHRNGTIQMFSWVEFLQDGELVSYLPPEMAGIVGFQFFNAILTLILLLWQIWTCMAGRCRCRASACSQIRRRALQKPP
uniref:hypothetical protein n=1 Tax=Litorimonas sp. TaxID=1892381 RepID=UPI003A89946A